MTKNRNSSKPIAVDIFAGAGGLTLGLKRAGFDVALAVEQKESAAKTYQLNNRQSVAICDDVRNVSGKKILEHVGKRIDLLAACPPCQGFTSLTSKWNKEDPRNKLVNEVVRLATELKPRAIMFENVPRLAESDKGKKRFLQLTRKLEVLGYKVSWFIADAADFGTAQHRRRLVVYAARTLIAPPTPTHGAKGTCRNRWRTIRDEIGGQPAPTVFDRKLTECSTLRSWHVVRDLREMNLARLAASKPGGVRWELPDDLRPPCHKGSSEGFRNVYGRMAWDSPSSTITGGCTSPSKGRFGHPTRLGTISVMEAAMLQDFPTSYRLATRFIDDACELIGNAFPAKLAQAAAAQVIDVL